MKDLLNNIKRNFARKAAALMTVSMTLLMGGCADDDFFFGGDNGYDPDYARITLGVPATNKITTRGDQLDEDALTHVDILIYKMAGADADKTLLQIEPIDNPDKNLRIRYHDAVKEVLTGGGEILIVGVANASGLTRDNAATMAKLNQLTDSQFPGKRVDMLMSGATDALGVSDMKGTVQIDLVRCASKLTVEKDESPYTASLTIEGFQFHQLPEKGYFTAGFTGLVDDTATKTESDWAADYIYGYSQKEGTNVNIAKKAFIVLQAKYDGIPCYYRIDLRTEDGEEDGIVKYRDIYLTPNTEYTVEVKQVRCKGYDDVAEAIKHPSDERLMVEIHEHVAEIMNMASDGIRELGVPKEYVYNGSTSESFLLKLFDKDGLYPTLTKKSDKLIEGEQFSMEIIEGSDVFKFTGIPTASSTSGTSSGETLETPTDGKLLDVPLGNFATYRSGQIKGKVKVTWKGLSVEVDLIWERKFKPSEICTVSFDITNSGSSVLTASEKADFWKYLIGTDTSEPVVKGVKKDENAGMIRNEGFHFPLMYGGTDEAQNWTYTYTVKPVLAGNWSVKTESDGWAANITFDKTSGSSGETFTMSMSADAAGWKYATGKLIITINNVEYPFDIYHTGFFHIASVYDKASKHASPKTPFVSQTLYYEVRTIGNRHWLDRNLGATAGGICIASPSNNGASQTFLDITETPFHNGSRGLYWKAAESHTYETPIMKDNLCPPGFRIPEVGEWDEIRNSSAFTNAQTVKDGKTFYQSRITDSTGLQVYFPKVGYLNKEKFTGEDNSGYYWTATPASGTEKQQIGHWLRALFLKGMANSYMISNVDDYCMPVRCIDDSESTAVTVTLGFKVKGFTHVYLYDAGKGYVSGVNDDQKIGLMTWPGQFVGEASSVDNESVNFTFNTQSKPEDLRVVLNYVKDGKITTYCVKLDTREGKTGVQKYNGWPLKVSYEKNGTSVTLGDGWTEAPKPEAPIRYRIYFPQSSTKFYMWYVDNGNQHIFPNGGLDTSKKYGSSYYYNDFNLDNRPTDKELTMSRADNHNDKALGKTLADFQKGDDGYYHAYIDENDNFHAGKPVNTPAPTIVKIIGNFNGWSMAGATPDENGDVKFENLQLNAAGTDSNQIGKFRMQIIKDNETKNYSYQNAVTAGSEVTLGESTSSMWISGASTNDLYDIEFNVETKVFKATKVGGSSTSENNANYQIQWKKDGNDFYMVCIKYTDGTYPSAFSGGTYLNCDGTVDNDSYFYKDFTGLIPDKEFNVFIKNNSGKVYVMRHSTLNSSKFASGTGNKEYYKIGQAGDFEPELATGKRRIYFKNEDNWNDPKIWGWTTGGGADYPLTKLLTNNTWVYYDGEPSAFYNIIFKNGDWANKYPTDGQWTVGTSENTVYYFDKNGSTDTARPWNDKM